MTDKRPDADSLYTTTARRVGFYVLEDGNAVVRIDMGDGHEYEIGCADAQQISAIIDQNLAEKFSL